jgi:hypothetical protein
MKAALPNDPGATVKESAPVAVFNVGATLKVSDAAACGNSENDTVCADSFAGPAVHVGSHPATVVAPGSVSSTTFFAAAR